MVSRLRPRGCSILLVVLTSIALALPLSAEHLPIRAWTTADGLPKDRVLAINEDSRGFIWMGGDGWVARFDGNAFRVDGAPSGIPPGGVWQFLEIPDGTLWLASEGGPCSMSPAAGQQPWRCERLGLTPAGDPIGVYHLYEDRDGVLWAATMDGLWRRRPGAQRFERQALGAARTPDGREALRWVTGDGEKGLWLATALGVGRLTAQGRFFQVRVTLDRDDRVFSVLRDREGRLWVAHVDDGLFVWMPPSASGMLPSEASLGSRARSALAGQPLPLPAHVGEVLHLSTRDGLADGRARNGLLETHDGAIWAGTVAGVVRVLNGHLESLGRSEGFGDYALSPSLEDAAGNVWFGSASGGAMRAARTGITSYGIGDGLPQGTVREFVEDRDGHLFAIGDGTQLMQLTGSRFESVRLNVPTGQSPGWGWNQVAFLDEAGSWWWSTSKGIASYPPVHSLQRLAEISWRRLYSAPGTLPVDVFRLFRDREGRTWAATTEPALFLLEPGAPALRRLGDDAGVPHSTALSFADGPQQETWIGFDNGRLGSWSHGRLRLLDGVRETDAIMALTPDPLGGIWYATEAGDVVLLRDLSSPRPTSRRFHVGRPESTVSVNGIDLDSFGRPYLATTAGVFRIEPASGRVTHLGRAEGMTNSVVRTVHRDRSGAMWFGTFQGLSRFIPEPPLQAPRSPSLRLVRLDIASHAVPLSEFGVAHIPDLELAPTENNLRFELAGLAHGDPCTFATRLADAQRDFSPLSDSPVFSYAALRAGSYRLEARAVCSGADSAIVSILAFTVQAPFWQRGWFVSLTVATLLGLAWIFHRQRVARLVAVERVRRQIATDLHDDLGQSLSRIAILSEVVKRAPIPDVDRLNEIADTARQLSESASEIVWAIDPRRDDLESLLVRLSRSAQELLADRGISWQFDLPPDAQAFALAPDARRQIYLILKEAAHNAARHSNAQRVELSLRRDGAGMLAEMRDDGCGFDLSRASERNGGNGLGNMRERASAFGGRLEVRAVQGQGTVVSLWIPGSRSRYA
jgi:signal transduction histidine kinase/ligand-binding sensor domain-containing protein